MTDPLEIIEAALADAHDLGMPADLLAKAIVRALEAAGIRLLSAEGVTEEMVSKAVECRDVEFGNMRDAIEAAIPAAPLFGKGSEK